MRKEAGKITNVEIQSSVTQVFYYLCVVTIQLIAPAVLVCAILLMSKSLSSKSLSHGRSRQERTNLTLRLRSLPCTLSVAGALCNVTQQGKTPTVRSLSLRVNRLLISLLVLSCLASTFSMSLIGGVFR